MLLGTGDDRVGNARASKCLSARIMIVGLAAIIKYTAAEQGFLYYLEDRLSHLESICKQHDYECK